MLLQIQLILPIISRWLKKNNFLLFVFVLYISSSGKSPVYIQQIFAHAKIELHLLKMAWEDLSQNFCLVVVLIIVVIIANYLWDEVVRPMLKKSGFSVSTLGNAAGYDGACLWGNKKNPWNTCNMS